METPEQERQRVAYHLTALSNGVTLGKKRFAEIERREKAAAAETARLREELDARTEALNEDIRARRDAERLVARDVERAALDIDRLTTHVDGLDKAAAVSIRKSIAPKTTVSKTTPVRDEKTGRLTETVTVDPDRPGIAVIRRIIRDASYRVVGSETYEVEVIDETDAPDAPVIERAPGESEHAWRSTPHLADANALP